jgi:integrase/recombinase XerD
MARISSDRRAASGICILPEGTLADKPPVPPTSAVPLNRRLLAIQHKSTLFKSILMRYRHCIMTDRTRVFQSPWEITREMFLSEEEASRLLAYVERVPDRAGRRPLALAQRDRLVIEALLFSGLRNSELCRLRVRDTIVGCGESVFLVRGTPRQDRTVFVPQALSLLVQEFVHVHRNVLAPPRMQRSKGDQPLLVNDRGGPLERTSLYRRVVRIIDSVGLGDRASVQLLRHTYGYLAYKRSGGNLLFVQRQMGHAHPMVTSVYAQFVDESYVEIANRVGPARPSPTSKSPHVARDRK